MPDDPAGPYRPAMRIARTHPELAAAALGLCDLIADHTGVDVDQVVGQLAHDLACHQRAQDEQVARDALAGRLLGMSEGIRRGQGFDELAEAFAALSVQCDEWADRWA